MFFAGKGAAIGGSIAPWNWGGALALEFGGSLQQSSWGSWVGFTALKRASVLSQPVGLSLCSFLWFLFSCLSSVSLVCSPRLSSLPPTFLLCFSLSHSPFLHCHLTLLQPALEQPQPLLPRLPARPCADCWSLFISFRVTFASPAPPPPQAFSLLSLSSQFCAPSFPSPAPTFLKHGPAHNPCY